MQEVKIIVFLEPIIVLITVIILFLTIMKRSDYSKAVKLFASIALTFAFILNFIWELIQIPLYKDASYDVQHIAICALAAVADALMVLLIYFIFVFIFNKSMWVEDLTLSKAAILMLVGGFGAIGVEKMHLLLGAWAYDESMPIIPIVDVGLSPVFQFILLPVCIYYLSYKAVNERAGV